MKSIKRVAALVMAILFVGVGVLSNVGTISQVEAAKPKISVKKKTLNQGQKVTLKITGGKGTIKWSVNNDNVKLNKTTGKKVKVTAVKAGTSKVTAVVKGKKLTSTIKVNGLNIVKKELNVGQKFTIKAKGLGKKIKWSQKGNVVKVSGKKAKATVTATKAGTGTVIAKVGKKSYKCTVVVSNPKVSGANKVSVNSGASTKLTLSGITSGTVVTWKSSNDKLVKVTGSGASATVQVIGEATVATNVTVSAVVNGVTYTWTVTVPAKVVEPDVPEIPEGSEYNPFSLALTDTDVEGQKAASVTVPAGATVWYQGMVAGMGLAVYAEGNDVFSVMHNGETYESSSDYMSGQVLEMSSLMGRPMVSFAIVNTSETEKTFTLTFAYPIGTAMNPDVAWDLAALYAVLPAGSSDGYYYVYTPEVDETVQLTVQDIYCDVEGAQTDFVVTMTNPETLVPVSKSYLMDAVDGVLTVDLTAGVDVVIQIVMVPGADWSIPEATVVVGKPKGTAVNPEVVYDVYTDVTVNAGAEYYMEVYAAGNTLVISGGDSIVTIDGVEHTSVDGVVSVFIPADPMAMGRQMPVSVVINNTTDATITYAVEIVAPTGTMSNPEKVDAGTYEVEMAEGSEPYYYTYIAEEDGTLEVEVSSTTGWFFVVNNITAGTWGENLWSGDAEASNVYTLEVSAGDEIQILVNTADAADKYAVAPAGTITLEVGYAGADTGLDTGADEDDSYGGIF